MPLMWLAIPTLHASWTLPELDEEDWGQEVQALDRPASPTEAACLALPLSEYPR